MASIKYDDLTDEYKWYAESVGKGVRAMAVGTIAAIWVVMSANGVTLAESGLFGLPASGLVRAAFIFASAALFLDLLQGIAAFWMLHIGLEKWETRRAKDESVSFSYDKESLGKFGVFLYWANTWLFPGKLFLATLAGATFVCLAFAVTLA